MNDRKLQGADYATLAPVHDSAHLKEAKGIESRWGHHFSGVFLVARLATDPAPDIISLLNR